MLYLDMDNIYLLIFSILHIYLIISIDMAIKGLSGY